MWSDILDQADRLRAGEEPFVLATVVAYKSPQSARPGSKAIILPDGTITGWLGGGCVQPILVREAKRVLQTGQPKLISICPEPPEGDWKGVESYPMTCQGGGSLEIYLEPVLPGPELLIVGSSPLARILCGLGRLLDFKVCVAGPEATADQFPEADLVLADLALARDRIMGRSFIVVATMGNGDEEGLGAVIGTSPAYLGLVASKRKAGALFSYLQDKGIPSEEINRVKCPAGLDLGGETLPEIALSVMAEITHLRRATRPELASKNVALRVMHDREPPAERAGNATEARDPVCGMMVETQSARYRSVFQEQDLYFCCLPCKETFDRSPENYLAPSDACGP